MDKKALIELGLDIEEIQRLIVQNLTDDTADVISDNVIGKIEYEMTQKAQTKVDDYVTELVTQTSTKVFQPLTSWGSSAGEPTTIHEMMSGAVEKWWNTKVDKSGKKCDYSSSKVRIIWLVDRLLEDWLDKRMRKEMDIIIEAGKEKVREAMAVAVTKEIKRIW